MVQSMFSFELSRVIPKHRWILLPLSLSQGLYTITVGITQALWTDWELRSLSPGHSFEKEHLPGIFLSYNIAFSYGSSFEQIKAMRAQRLTDSHFTFLPLNNQFTLMQTETSHVFQTIGQSIVGQFKPKLLELIYHLFP